MTILQKSGCGLYEGFSLGALRPLMRVIGFSQTRGAGYTRDAGSTREFTVLTLVPRISASRGAAETVRETCRAVPGWPSPWWVTSAAWTAAVWSDLCLYYPSAVGRQFEHRVDEFDLQAVERKYMK